MKRVMVFGVFDGVHAGHRAFFKEAKSYGDYLIAVVAPDHVVEHLKGKLPSIDIGWRLERLKEEDNVDEVVMGDEELSSWDIIKKYRPAVIALGYDQKMLKKDLQSPLPKIVKELESDAGPVWIPEIKVMTAFELDTHHNSFIK